MATIEKRIFSVGCSLRAAGKGKDLELAGYAAKFNVLSHSIGGSATSSLFRERIAPGAFTRALREKQDVIATIQHDPSRVLGRTKSGTLRLAQDDTGLSFRVALDPNQQSHRDFHAGVLRGDWDSMSFAFTVPDGGDDWDGDGQDEEGNRCARRTLKDLNLKDIAVVQGPAYPNTEVSARSLAYYSSAPVFIPRTASVDEENRKRVLALGQEIYRDKDFRASITEKLSERQKDIETAEDLRNLVRALRGSEE